MREFYEDERPQSDWREDGQSDGNGGLWGGGGSGSSSDEDRWYLLSGDWRLHQQLILLDGDGMMLRHQTGEILQGMYGCITITVECQIRGDSSGGHVRCLLLTNSLDPDMTGTLLDQFAASETNLYVRWQTGHWPHDSINTARFRINGKVSSWINIPLTGSYVKIGTVSIRDGEVVVKYIV